VLKDHQDAFGHQLYDYYRLQDDIPRITGIVERYDGYVDDSGSSAVYFSEHKDWVPLEKKTIRYARGRILDIGCGAGRHAIYLQEKGHDVVCIDNSPLAVEVCKLRGLKNAVLMPFTQINSTLGTFDTVIMMGNNFGLFGSLKGARRLLAKLHGITSEKGRIIATTNDVYQTDLPEHLSYQEYNRNHGRMGGQVKLKVRYRKYATPWFDYLMVSKVEMEDILEGAGWKVARYIDSEGSHYVAIIEKKKERGE